MEEYSIGSHKKSNANFRPKPPPKPDSILKKVLTPTTKEFAESKIRAQKEKKVRPPVLPKPVLTTRRPEIHNLFTASNEEKVTNSSQPNTPKPVRKISATILALTDSMKLNEASAKIEVASSPKPLTKPGSLRKTSLFDTFNNTENIESTHIFNILPKSIQQPESSHSKFPFDIPKVDYNGYGQDYGEISIPSPSTPKVKFALYPIDYNEEKSSEMLDNKEWEDSDTDSFDSDAYDDVYDEKQESDNIEIGQIIKTKHLPKNKLPSQMST